MKKRREPMEFPQLEVIAFPGDARPLSIIIPAEYELTGEISISLGAETTQLVECKQLLEAIVNSLADELWLRARVLPPPWKTTDDDTQESTVIE